MRRIVIHGYHEAIWARFDHFCGIYGALSAGRWASGSPAFRFSLGDADHQKYLQEPRDIRITQCKHKVSHFLQIIFYT